MSQKKLTYKEYQALVESQLAALLDNLVQIASGDLEVKIAIPEGINAVTDLAYGMMILLEDLRYLIDEQQEAQSNLEKTVLERTAELEKALEEITIAQRRYVSEQWEEYIETQEEYDPAQGEIQEEFLPAFKHVVETNTPYIADINNSDNATFALSYPVRYADESIGVLGFQSEELETLDEADLAAVEDIIEQVGLALESQRLFDQTQLALAETERQASRLRRLTEMGAELNTALTIQDVYETAIRYTSQLLQTDIVEIALLSSDFQTLKVLDNPKAPLPNQVFGLDDTSIGEAVYQRQALYWSDIEGSKFRDHEMIYEKGMRSSICAPLIAQRVLGTLNAASPNVGTFSEQDKNLMLQIASLVAATIENRQLLEQTAQRASQLERLAQVEAELSRAESPQALIETLGKALTNYPFQIRLHYVEIDENSVPDVQVPQASWENGQYDTSWHKNTPPYQLVRIDRNLIWINSPEQITYVENISESNQLSPESKAWFREREIGGFAIIPLRNAGIWQGKINIRTKDPRPFTEDERFVLENVRQTLGAVVASRRAAEAQKLALQESERRSRELDALNQVGRVVVQQLDEIQLTNAIFEQISQIIDFNIFFLGVYTPESHLFKTLLYSDGQKQLYDIPDRTLIPQNGTYQSIAQQKTILIQPTPADYAAQPAPDRSQLIGDRTTLAPSRIYIPIVSGQTVLGSMSLHSNHFNAYSQNDINLLNGIANYFGVAWQNASLFNATKRRADRERLVYDISQKILNTTSVEKALQTTVQELGKALKSRYTQVALQVNDHSSTGDASGGS